MLLGYYRIPSCPAEPLEVVVNPQGAEERARVSEWGVGARVGGWVLNPQGTKERTGAAASSN